MMKHYCRGLLAILFVTSPVWATEPPEFYQQAQTIVFLGDSNTDAGYYVTWIDAQLRLAGLLDERQILNLGLASETVTGLSEPDHPFPRPDVHERLDRVLKMTQPDLVIACYGMNDGIYFPFSEDRFKAYQQGIDQLIKKVQASGARLVLLTPPPFDPGPLQGTDKLLPAGQEKYAWFAIYENYDEEVIARYAKWILDQKERVAMVIDIYSPLKDFLTEQRKTNADFAMSSDGVHFNQAGHKLVGDIILKAWNLPVQSMPDPKFLDLVNRRQTLLHRAWLSHVGHKRPGVKPGLPLKEAQQQAAELEQQIDEQLDE